MLTKSQVVTHLAEKSGVQKKSVAGLLEELVALAAKECKGGGQFVIPGLGKDSIPGEGMFPKFFSTARKDPCPDREICARMS